MDVSTFNRLKVYFILGVLLLTILLLIIGTIVSILITRKKKKEHIRITAEAEKIDAMTANGRITDDEARELKEALGPGTLIQTFRKPDIHITIVGILNVVFGSLGVFTCGGYLFTTSSLFRHPYAGDREYLWGIIGCLSLLLSFMRIISVAWLMKGALWARIAIIIFAMLGIFIFPRVTAFGIHMIFPLGAVLCIYTLWALLPGRGRPVFCKQ